MKLDANVVLGIFFLCSKLLTLLVVVGKPLDEAETLDFVDCGVGKSKPNVKFLLYCVKSI